MLTEIDYIISSQYLVHAGDKYRIRSVFLDLNTSIVLSQSNWYLLNSINITSLVDLAKFGRRFSCAQKRLPTSKGYSPLLDYSSSHAFILYSSEQYTKTCHR